MSLLDLPHELHVLIVGYLDRYRHPKTGYPEARALLLTCKRFSWLKDYRVLVPFANDYYCDYYYVNMAGRADGPLCRFAPDSFGFYLPARSSFLGYYFIHQGRVIGDHLITRSSTADGYDIVYNGKAYNHQGHEHRECYYCQAVDELYERLTKLNFCLFEEDNIHTVHIKSLFSISKIKIILDTSNLRVSPRVIEITPTYLDAIERDTIGNWEPDY